MKRSGKKRDLTRHCYTIVEMMMVVAVFLIIMTMAIAAWLNSGSQTKLRSAVRLVNAQLNLARAKAVAERKQVGLYFAQNTGDGKEYYGYGCRLYYYNGTEKGDPVLGENWVILPGGTLFSSARPGSSDYTASPPAGAIIFDAKGRVRDESAVPALYLTSGVRKDRKVAADEAYFAIAINPFTGRNTTTYHEVTD